MIVSDELIKQEFLKDNGKMRRNNKKYLLYHDYLSKRFNDSNSDEESVYRILFDIEQKPICPVCGGPINFINYSIGFPKTCSKKCAVHQIKDSFDKHTKEELTKEFIKSFFIDKDSKYIPQRLTPKYLKENGWYDLLMTYYDDTTGPQETLYRILNDLNVRPVCKICGKPVKFDNRDGQGFQTYCSRSCSNKDPEILAKNAANVSKTLTKAYQERGDEIKEKRRKTLLENHGIDSCTPFASENFQNKAKETIKARYGVNNVWQLEKYRQKGKLSLQQKSVELQRKYGYDIEYTENDTIIVHNGCSIHGDIEMTPYLFNKRSSADRRDHLVLCPICNKLRDQETTIERIIKNLLQNLNVEYIQHYRKLISPKEVDFYLPEYNIAIECNGLYWHSGEINKHSQEEKYKLCKEKGTKLLQFWEDDIINKSSIIWSIIKSSIGKNQNRIYARNCEIRNIKNDEYFNFLEENHLLGKINASIKLGLYYNNELVEVMSFGSLRANTWNRPQEGYYEMYRLCTKKDTTVVGGASKLFEYFIESYNPIRVLSFSFNDYSEGNVYEKLGFKQEGEDLLTYSYWKKGEMNRINRHSFEMNVKSYIDNYDESISRKQNIDNDGKYFRCYNSGTKKFIWNNQLT